MFRPGRSLCGSLRAGSRRLYWWDAQSGIVGEWEAVARAVTVEMDEKGRVHIPATVRREVKARRFTLSLEKGRILMEPVKSPALVKGKYKGLLKVTMEELEEAQERLVTAGRR